MARRTTIRALFASIAAVAVLGTVIAAASDDAPPTSVRATGGDSGQTTRTTTEPASTEETTTSTSADATEPPASTRSRTRTSWGRTLSTGEPTAATGSDGTTTTTAPSAPTTTLPELEPPPAPAEGHAQFWGRVVDEAGQPVRGACVSMHAVLPPGSAPVVVQSKADGSYLIDVEVPWDEGIPFGIGARMCPGDERYLLTAIADKPATDPRIAKPGSSHRTEMWMPFGATTVDVTFVDLAGRPVLGLCGNTGTGVERWVADERGHIRVDRPPSRELHVAVQGACDYAVGVWDAAYSYGWDDFPLTGGANSVTYVVPWQSGDRAGEAITINSSSGNRFDLFAVSTEPGEPDPSCIGAFAGSRWFRLSGQGRGFVRTTLSRGGSYAVWAYAPSGARVELGCARAGTTVPITSGHSDVWVQVIPDPGPAQSGTVS